MSGNALCEFCVRTSESQANVCREYAKHLGYSGDDSRSLFEWIKAKPIEEMQKMNGFIVPASGILAYLPNLDGDFLPKTLDELRKDAPKKDVMIGVAEHEGLFFDFLARDPTKPDDALKRAIGAYYKEDTGEDYLETQQKVYNFYTKGVDTEDYQAMKRVLIDVRGSELS